MYSFKNRIFFEGEQKIIHSPVHAYAQQKETKPLFQTGHCKGF